MGAEWPDYALLLGKAMHLPHRFYKFPFRFDAERLRAELFAIPEEAWRRHVQDFAGNSALPLIATNGDVDDHGFRAPMMATEHLTRLPYLRQVLGTFRTLLGRARFMRLEPNHGVPSHIDMQYYWRTHTRVHIPIVTHPDVRFYCEDQSVHMAAGEAWTFDNWREHKVVNEPNTRRVHLTFDTYGSTEFWDLARPFGDADEPPLPVPYRPGFEPKLLFETYAGDAIMPPGEVELELSRITADVAACRDNAPSAIADLRSFLDSLIKEWRILWHLHGPTPQGHQGFLALSGWARNTLDSISPTLRMASNNHMVVEILPATIAALAKPALGSQTIAQATSVMRTPRFDRPVFIVSAPRSGSTLLYETLANNAQFWTLGGEGHRHVETIEALKPRNHDFESNRLTAQDATADTVAKLRANYLSSLRTIDGRPLDHTAPETVRFLEKTPKNALRIPFFKAIFPDAKFIFLHREPQTNISAIIEAWRSGNFVTYRDLPGWTTQAWSLLLIPGWRELAQASLAEIATRQWRDTNEIIMSDLAALPSDDWCMGYEDFLADPATELRRLCDFADVSFGAEMQTVATNPLKHSRFTLTPPNPGKWRKNEAMIAAFLNQTRDTARKLRSFTPQSTIVASPHEMV